MHPGNPGERGKAGPSRRLSRPVRIFVRNPTALMALLVLLVFIGAAVFAPWVAPHDPYAMDLTATFLPVGSPDHLLGTDNFGRDILSRLIYGARISLLIGVVVVSIAAVVGSVLGLLAGYYGGWIDQLVIAAGGGLLRLSLLDLGHCGDGHLGAEPLQPHVGAGLGELARLRAVGAGHRALVANSRVCGSGPGGRGKGWADHVPPHPAQLPHPRHRHRGPWGSRKRSWPRPPWASWAWESGRRPRSGG